MKTDINQLNLNSDQQPAPEAPDNKHGHDGVAYDYTTALDDVRNRNNLNFGRHDIARDTPVEGGVYWGSYGGEAIVVDGEKYPVGLQKALGRVHESIQRPDGSVDKGLVFRAVFDTVRDMMRYDAEKVDEIFQRSGGKDFTKIALETYVSHGVGVCRHQALFAAQILERLRDQGVVSGATSVDRNAVRRPNDMDDKYDGHAWVRYTNSGGTVFIIDIAQNRIGKLEDLIAQRDAGNFSVWEYARPDDREKIRAKLIGRKANLMETGEQNFGPVGPQQHSKLVRGAVYKDGILDQIPIWDTAN